MQDVLAEALAMSASFSHDNEANKPGGPLSSPSRFLKLASQPSEGRLRPPTSQDQASNLGPWNTLSIRPAIRMKCRAFFHLSEDLSSRVNACKSLVLDVVS